jgi:hypothetical protein
VRKRRKRETCREKEKGERSGRVRGNEGFFRELSYPAPTLLAFLLSVFLLFIITILRCERN